MPLGPGIVPAEPNPIVLEQVMMGGCQAEKQ